MLKEERNPNIVIDGKKIQFIGDPHFGRKFLNTFSSKMGVRESMMLRQFKNLLSRKCDYVILVGDLFDKFVVQPSIVLSVYNALVKAARDDSDKHIYIIPGNHDLSKDKTKVSSYMLLKIMLQEEPNITVILDSPETITLSEENIILLDAYNPFYETEEESYTKTLAGVLEERTEQQRIIYVGHWDDPRFDRGYLPNSYVLGLENVVCVSGHVHIPFSTLYKKTPYHCIGSLQPYTFGEDPEQTLYLKIEHSVFEKDYKTLDIDNKYVRVLNCPKGYSFDKPLPCLSISYSYHSEGVLGDEEEFYTGTGEQDDFDFITVYLKMLEEKGVDEEIRLKVHNALVKEEEEIEI